ncbi:hypothetical protein JCM16303_002760 [Sporobolomyces ruberrimus]
MTTVRVGVGCFVVNPKGEFIVGVRKGSHGAGCIQLPGGHLEIGESFEQCAIREVLEETGLDVGGSQGRIKFLTTTNDVFSNEKHYVTIFVVSEIEGGEPRVTEPEKCESWEWTSWQDLVRMANDTEECEKLFLPLRNLIKQRPEIDPTRAFT